MLNNISLSQIGDFLATHNKDIEIKIENKKLNVWLSLGDSVFFKNMIGIVCSEMETSGIIQVYHYLPSDNFTKRLKDFLEWFFDGKNLGTEHKTSVPIDDQSWSLSLHGTSRVTINFFQERYKRH